MPRRISDYPDAFAGWNLISSFGSIISVASTWLFLFIGYEQLVEGRATSRYPWLRAEFYTDTLQSILNRTYHSLEWGLNSPPKPHAFVSLPLQSIDTIIEAAIEAAKNIDIINEAAQIIRDALDAKDNVTATDEMVKYEEATAKVRQIESTIIAADIEAYKAEVDKHVKK